MSVFGLSSSSFTFVVVVCAIQKMHFHNYTYVQMCIIVSFVLQQMSTECVWVCVCAYFDLLSFAMGRCDVSSCTHLPRYLSSCISWFVLLFKVKVQQHHTEFHLYTTTDHTRRRDVDKKPQTKARGRDGWRMCIEWLILRLLLLLLLIYVPPCDTLVARDCGGWLTGG